MTAVASVGGVTQQCSSASGSPPSGKSTEDRWDYSHHQAFVGGMHQEAHMRGSSGSSGGQPNSLVGMIAAGVAQAIGQKLGCVIADGVILGVSAGYRQIGNGWRYMFPLSPEELLRRALFTRRQVDQFMSEAIMDNKTFITMQPHRLSQQVRSGLEADGYRIKETDIGGAPCIQIHFTQPEPKKPKAKSSGWFSRS